MADWLAHWHVLSHRYRQLEDSMENILAVLARPEASARERAGALIEASRELCAILRDYERRGVFRDIAEAAQGASAAQREMVLTELSRVLEMEATVLARLGLDTALIGKILADIERTLAGTRASTPLDAIAWQQGLSRASEQVCSFPQVEILAMDNDFGRFVRRVTKTRTLIRVMFTGAANIVAASQFPEPATIKSLSTFLAFVAASMLNEQG